MHLKTLAQAASSELIHGGYVPALAAPCLILTLGLIRGDATDLALLAIIYLLPLVVYAYDYHHGMSQDRLAQPERARHLLGRARAYPCVIGGYVVVLSVLIISRSRRLPELAATVAILLAAGILYTVLLKRVTRYLTGFKSYYVTGVWVLAIDLLYALYTVGKIGMFLPVMTSFLYVRLLANVIFFDLRDIRSDQRDGLKTVPVVLGWTRTIKLLYLLCLAAPVPLLVGVLTGAVPSAALGLSLLTTYSLYYVRLAEVRGEGNMSANHYALADLEYLLWPLVGLVGKWLDGRCELALMATLLGTIMAATVLLIWLRLRPGNVNQGETG